MGDAIIAPGYARLPVQAGRSNLVPRSSENISLRYIALHRSAKRYVHDEKPVHSRRLTIGAPVWSGCRASSQRDL